MKLSIAGINGQGRVLSIADRPGAFLGVTAVISGEPHSFTAQAVDAAEVSFIQKRDFLRLMHEHAGFAECVVAQLSDLLSGAYLQIRLLQRPAAERLAALLLERSNKSISRGKRSIRTHEGISQAIGTSRKTVTRLLSEWNRNGWIRGTRPNLQIIDRAALEQLRASATP